jgi:phosphoglycerate dehydrogenase-like enzyme
MQGKVLVTDNLFITDEHVKQIKDAGYEVQRLDKANATEEELIAALQGKVGYVLGGIEKVTERVIEEAKDLKVIAFTGADWQALITGWEKAKERGIKISNAPGANSPAVAEFAFAMALLMERNLQELGRPGDKTFQTSDTLHNAEIGVIGAGKIGSRIIKMASTFSPSKIRYFSRSKHPEVEDDGAGHTDLGTLLKMSDVIFIAAPGSAGMVLDSAGIDKLKNNALVVHISPLNMVDFEALLPRLQEGTLRAAVDWPAPNEEFLKLPMHTWYSTNNHTAYNTHSVIKQCSDMGTASLLNLLAVGEDQYRVL